MGRLHTDQTPARGEGGRGGRGDGGPIAKPEAAVPVPEVPDSSRPPQKPPDTPPIAFRPESSPEPRFKPPEMPYLLAGALALAGGFAYWTWKLRRRLHGFEQNGSTDGSGPSLHVTATEARDGAVKGLKLFGLDKRDDWKSYLTAGVSLAATSEPLKVQQIGAREFTEGFFYLVPIRRSDDTVGAVACVDAVTGEYQEVAPFPGDGPESWGRTFEPWRTEASTREWIAKGKVDLKLPGGHTPDPDAIGIHPTLVWQSCIESRSPFYPFRLVKVADQVRYIRIDGQVFEKLNSFTGREGYDKDAP